MSTVHLIVNMSVIKSPPLAAEYRQVWWQGSPCNAAGVIFHHAANGGSKNGTLSHDAAISTRTVPWLVWLVCDADAASNVLYKCQGVCANKIIP